jgi:hypothetical protein
MVYAPKQIGLPAVFGDIAASGALAIANIERYRAIVFAQVTPGVSVTLPAPSLASIIFGVDLLNSGTASLNVAGSNIAAGAMARAAWNGSAWVILAAGNTGLSGVLNTINAAGLTHADDTTSFLAGYTVYEIDVLDLVPSQSGDSLNLQLYTTDGFGPGSTNGYVTDIIWGNAMTSGAGGLGWVNTNQFYLPNDVSNAAGLGASGRITIYDPASTVNFKKLTMAFAFWTPSGQFGNHQDAAISTANTLAVTGFRINTTSGQPFTSGKVIVRAVA